LKDVNHVVSMDGYKLSRRIHMEPVERVEAALKTLSEPDTRRKGQKFEGKRIEKVADGWLVLNGDHYRELVREEMKLVRNRKAQAKWRERQKVKKGLPLPGEQAYVKTVEEKGVAAADAQMDGQDGSGHDFEDHVRERLNSPEGLKAQVDLAKEMCAPPVPFVSPWGNGGAA
jgi:hypothetical protein